MATGNFRQQINLFVNQELTPQANAQHLIEVAKQALSDVQSSGQAPKDPHSYQTIVDGAVGDIERATKSIYFRFGYALEAVQFAITYLTLRSHPSLSGRFVKSFWISVDGKYMAPGSFNPNQVFPFGEIVIGNVTPYNRRVDLNLIGNRRLRYRTPPGMYDDAVTAIKRRFGNVLTVKRVYDYGFPSKYVPVHAGSRYHSPAIVITPQT